jgi:uncharacterized small protein (DUF1192 family)
MSDESVRRMIMARDEETRAAAARDLHERVAWLTADLERTTAELAFVRREIARQRALYEAAMAVLEIAMSTGNAGAIEDLVKQIMDGGADMGQG